jgi:hypothetical protein
MSKLRQLYALVPRVDVIKIIVNALKTGKNALVFVGVLTAKTAIIVIKLGIKIFHFYHL